MLPPGSVGGGAEPVVGCGSNLRIVYVVHYLSEGLSFGRCGRWCGCGVASRTVNCCCFVLFFLERVFRFRNWD